MKTRPVGSILLSAIFLCGALLAHAETAADGDAAAQQSVLVQTTAVSKGSVPRIVQAYGVAQPSPGARDTLMAPMAAIVARVYVRVGQSVTKGEPLLELAPTPAMAAAYSAAVSAQQVAADLLKRTRQLRETSLATEPQVAAAQNAASDASEALAALRAQGAGGLSILRAARASAVTVVSVGAHAIVAEGAPLLELAAQSGLVLLTGVVPSEATAIKKGDPASITAVGGGRPAAGRVALRGAVVDPANGLVPVEIELPAGVFLPGESAQVAITTEMVGGWVVPHEAVLVNDSGASYVVQAVHGQARLVPVQVQLSAGERDVVAGRLDPGLPLILAGAYQLQDGMKVRLKNAAEPTAQ
jgi:RND family efflux transporter MFP subunit